MAPTDGFTRRNGLQALTNLGVPDSALTTLLIAAATLTLLPYAAGREFGPYSIPDVLPWGVFWLLTVVMPLLWVALLARVFGADSTRLRRAIIVGLLLELAATGLGYASSTTTETRDFDFALEPGQASATFTIDLPSVSRATQRLDVTVLTLRALRGTTPNGAGVHIYVCGASNQACEGEQRAVDATIVKYFQRGTAAISVFNYATNPAVQVRLRAAHLRRRLL